MNEQIINLCIDSLTADVADAISREKGISITVALQEFMKTKTYGLLFQETSFLYLETTEYIYDMLLAELREDWDSWLEI